MAHIQRPGSSGGNFWILLALMIILMVSRAHGSFSQVTFSDDYDSNKLPPVIPPDKAVQVNVSMNLRNIFEVNEKSQYISLETSIRMYWVDPRLSSVPSEGREFSSVNGPDIKKFWVPDLFIDQAKALRSPTFEVKPASLRVFPDGTIRYSSRVNYDVACNMDFHAYPVDRQLCEIKYESFGYTSDQLHVRWKPTDSKDMNVNPNITLDQFSQKVIFESNYATDYYEQKFPGVILRIALERKVYYHLIQTYIPSALFVIIAWLSLMIDPAAIPGRISMVMMTLLTLMAMFSGVRQMVPKVSYISFLDYWMVMCIVFIFLVLFEFPVVHTLIRKGKRRDADLIERAAIIVIPILFICFNVIYWTTLLTQ